MECNKEEAFRAKDISLKKMEAKDFLGARKFALKAQQLYCDIGNISQMICVCDVHCSAESNMIGNDLDWYGILQIEQTANETMIKKQYRKFALLLHPDKNKFAGAEAAFKLIGEAQRVLLDKEKRQIYDMKCRTTSKLVRHQPPQQASRNAYVTKTSRVQTNVSSHSNSHVNATNQQPKQQVQPGAAANRIETFWTQCPFCTVRYQYYIEVLNRALRCQSCKKPFIAYDMLTSGARPGSDATQPVFLGKNIPNVFGSKAGSKAMNKQASNASFRSGINAEASQSKKARKPHKGPNKVRGKVEHGSKPSKKVNSARGKKNEEKSSESIEFESSLESEEGEIETDLAHQFDSDGVHCTRSSRNKRGQVSYSENVIDNERTINPAKKAKEGGPCGPTTKVDTSEKTQQPFVSVSATSKESHKEKCNSSNGSETVDESAKKSCEADDGCISASCPETPPEPEFHEYPDPEFCDFDKFREDQCFKVGQVWAAYDTADAMPRFYAKIRKIHSLGFKLRITWLEPNPGDQFGIDWSAAELPFSCGKFKYGHSENTEDRLMFSHQVIWEKGGGKDAVLIYPRKGETWALFKSWNPNWHSIPDNNRKFEYEYVEILSEYDETVGIRVALLGKLKGFASLFCRKSTIETQILPSEELKFSHRVPSSRMSGNERDDVPMDSFELDPASITLNLEEISLPRSNGDAYSVNLSAKVEEVNQSVKAAEKLHGNNVNGTDYHQDIVDPVFYNFNDQKSLNKFQIDQVWALYSDIDGLPKYYGIIKKINLQPHFKVQIAWMDACYHPDSMILWKEKEMPISCGRFEIIGNRMETYAGNSSFSHQVRAYPTGKKNMYAIYPRKDEVWALYKNWNASMTVAEFQNCDYDIVEVFDENDLHIKVVVLERVNIFHSVFKPHKKGDSFSIREISRNEVLRFSHQIPSFKLTDERGGSLRGYWELDPAAFPNHLLYKL